MQQKVRKNLIIVLALLCLMSVIATASYAYFSSDLKINGYANVKIELLFDRLDEDSLLEYQSQLTGNTLTESDLVWGHKGNPYVISEERHLQNLSVLQNIGFFYNKFIAYNYTNGTFTGNSDYSDGYDVPYFLISTRTGDSVVIDASKRVIKPIGNDEYPFIGSVKGVSGNDVYLPNGKTTTTSAVHGVTVKTSKSSIDYGLFGLVSYLGEEPEITGEEIEAPTFAGFISSIGNILFSDVKIKVISTIWDDIVDFVKNHLFYKSIANVDPEETHHLGIIVGHVEYANLYSISIYYSSEEIPAIDLDDSADLDGKLPSYASATGYIGFLYNLNPEVNDGIITVGSGIDSADISYGFEGGGGLNSGIMPGYIRADQMAKIYGHYANEEYNENEDLCLIKACDEEKNPLVQEVTNTTSTNYYFTDGVFTFALSSGQSPDDTNLDNLDTIADIWKDDKDNDGAVDVDEIELANSWSVGQRGEELFYYKNLQKVTSLSELKEGYEKGYEYYIGRFSDTGAFSFMNLTSKVNSSVGGEVSAQTAQGTLRDGSLGLQYKSKSERTNDEIYTIKISNVGSKQNASGASVDTFTFTSTNSGYSLGVARGQFIVYYYSINCSTVGSNKNADYNLVLSVDNDGAWTFQRLDINNGSDSYNAIGFNGSSFSLDWIGTTSAVPVYIYKITGNTDNVNQVPYTYVPNEVKHSLPANQYVLYPQVETSGNATKTTTNYEIKSLKDLGWGDDSGSKLWETDENGNAVINKMFDIKQVVDWSLAVNLGNWGVDFGSGGGTVLAPVGSGSYQKQVYLPTGSIGFCINKVPENGAKIRVIVKIPQSNGLRALGMDSDSSSDDHYLGIWQGKEKNSNSWFSYASFNIEDAYKKVELPRSHIFIESDSTSPYVNGSVSTDKEYLNVKYNGQEYQTMLQGGHYLMAYEFVVNNEGLYILAATDVRMQIAYCSVDGVASSGRDGTGGSPLGDIDYVYDNGSKVLLVTDGGTNEDGTENPNEYYYESFAFLHFVNLEKDGTKNKVNQEKIYIYRWVGGDGDVKTNITINVEANDEFVKCDPIKSVTDNIKVNYTPRN